MNSNTNYTINSNSNYKTKSDSLFTLDDNKNNKTIIYVVVAIIILIILLFLWKKHISKKRKLRAEQCCTLDDAIKENLTLIDKIEQTLALGVDQFKEAISAPLNDIDNQLAPYLTNQKPIPADLKSTISKTVDFVNGKINDINNKNGLSVLQKISPNPAYQQKIIDIVTEVNKSISSLNEKIKSTGLQFTSLNYPSSPNPVQSPPSQLASPAQPAGPAQPAAPTSTDSQTLNNLLSPISKDITSVHQKIFLLRQKLAQLDQNEEVPRDAMVDLNGLVTELDQKIELLGPKVTQLQDKLKQTAPSFVPSLNSLVNSFYTDIGKLNQVLLPLIGREITPQEHRFAML